MKRRLGERRVILGLLGVPFIAFGIAILKNDQEAPFSTTVQEMANSLWGWLWIIVGAYALIAMLSSSRKKVIEEVGYGLLIMPPILWATAYLVTLLTNVDFYIFVGFLVTTTIVVLILYLARYMRNG
jgi:bacteriorhodopsin